uniref:EOG090X0J9J n=1 Tax=Alona affinis TaxID=381656 RepID=A0A9N6WWS9_9CRUS|nr:EOG090X0J9J [Alona affinis]
MAAGCFTCHSLCWASKEMWCRSPAAAATTLSTSTSSYSPLETHDPQLNRLASAMFSKVDEYLQSELTSSRAEYQLLEQMNRVTAAKYRDLHLLAASAGKGLIELNEKFKNLQVYLDQIDQIEDQIGKLEHAAYKLDAYTVRLENKFKSLAAEKR